MTAVTCSNCGLRQWVPISGSCRRCSTNLGFRLIEIPLNVHNNLIANNSRPDLRFGPALRAMRLRQGRSQNSVSSSARVPRSSLSRVESNTCTPSLSTLARILCALGVESLYIRLGNSVPQPKE
jgi:DNA-binding XRE family transcriptional regulator